jgi:pyruvate dehydrogenase E2 component (dihydrolipoamide acetyltransferase)
MSFLFKLPDVGEGLTEGEIVRWRVKEGDAVREDQVIVEVLTDKATVEIPSPKTGKIAKLMAKEGQVVKVHSPIVEIAVEGETSAPAAERPSAPSAAPRPNGGASAPSAAPAGGGQALATPAVRKLAQEKGVNLANVRGTGPGGRILAEDVESAAKGGGAPVATAAAPAGTEERIPLRGIRRMTAQKMSQSHAAVAQVTHMDEADATALVALREEMKAEGEKRGVKLTYLAFIIKALAKALKQHPDLNATLDEAAQEIVRKKSYNIGIAVNTEHGLFKPVIKDADKKDLWQLAKEVQTLADKARTNTLEPSDLSGGTFTVTNVGPIGGLFATPQVTLPEVGILGIMKLAKKPVVREDKIVIGHVLTLCLSFDHRVLDGAEAAEFTNALIASIENPRTIV